MGFFNNKKVFLIYGSGGWIGSMFITFIKENYNNIIVIKGTSRIEDTHSVSIEIAACEPTNVISFNGRTHGTVDEKEINTIDYLEYPGKLVENIRDNLFGPVQLALLCKEKGIHYTYLGTGCIFNSAKNQIFDECDLPNYFGSGYSVVKGFTDQLMHDLPVLNLRIRMPISNVPNPRNFINKITTYEKICSIENSMTVLDDFFPIFTDLIVNKKTGTWNCTNPGTITHNKILSMYRDIIDPSFSWKNFTLTEQQKILKSDRSNNHLNTSKLEIHYPSIKPIEESIKTVLEKMKNNVF